MSTQCSMAEAPSSLLSRIAVYVECHAELASHAGFGFGQTGTVEVGLLTSCLTIYVALIGYRMILGRSYDARAAVLACARVGIVIAFATSWSSYQPVIHAVVMQGPTELAATLLGRMNTTLSTPVDAISRLEFYRRDIRDGIETPIQFDGQAAVAAGGEQMQNAAPSSNSTDPVESVEPNWPVPDLAGFLTLFSLSSAYLAIRLTTGLLLAIGPLLIPFALFDMTLALFEGWVRALIWVTLSTTVVIIVGSLGLSFIQSEVARGMGDATTRLGEDGLSLIGTVFGMSGWAALIATGLIARGFRLRSIRLPILATATATAPRTRSQSETLRSMTYGSTQARAYTVGQAMVAQAQRDRSASLASTTRAPRHASSMRPESRDAPDHRLAQRRTPSARPVTDAHFQDQRQ